MRGKIMKKKFLCVALVVLALSVTGCNEKPVDGEGNVTSESTEESSVSQESTDSDVSSIESSVEESSSSVEESSSVQESTEQNQITTLEDYYSQPLQKSNLDAEFNKQKSANAQTFSDMGYYVKGNVFTNWYQYAVDIDKELAVSYFDSSFTYDLVNSMIEGIANEAGVEDVTIQFIYRDMDGNDIYNKCFVRGHLEDSIVVPSDTPESTEPLETETTDENIDLPIEEEILGSTLEELFATPALKEMMDEQIASMKETYSSVYSDISFRVEENTLIYSYQYAVDVPDPSATAASLETGLADTAKSLISTYESSYGYKDVSVQYIFLDKNGTEIFNKTYTE